MRCIVTGGLGFIGSNIALELQRQGNEVVIINDFANGSLNNINGFEGEVIREDIRNIDWTGIKSDIFFHEAAITGVIDPKSGSIIDENTIIDTNFNASLRIFDYCSKRNIPLIYASSASVYGNSPPPQKESDAGFPLNAYGKSKWLFDKYVLDSILGGKTENLIVGLRYFNVFGPGERYKGLLASMVWKLMQQMVAGKRPQVFKYGEQKRDQVYIKDVVKANMLSMKAEESCIVNVGSGDSVSFNRMINAINAVLDTSFEPEYIDNPYESFYQNETKADLTLAREKIGYTPEWKFESAVYDYAKTEIIC